MKHLLFILIVVTYSQVSFCQNENHGPFKEYYDNGQLKVEGYYRNNKKAGLWKEYYSNGKISAEYTFNNKGKATGDENSYAIEGNLIYQSKRLNNRDLVAKTFYNSGKLQSILITDKSKSKVYKEYFESGILKVESSYLDWDLTGVWKRFYETGEKEWEVNYNKGNKHGAYKAYYKNGQVKLEGNHLENLKEGEEKRYFYNGQLEWAGSYLNDNFNKEWIQYNTTGDKISTLNYKKGKLKGKKDNLVLKTIPIPDGYFEQVPIFPGCENELGNSAKKKCMSSKISQFVNKKFNTYIANSIDLVGKQRIDIDFKIDKTGKVIDVRAIAPHPELEKEAIRVIYMLPEMTPGKQRGKLVNVPYTLPLLFMIRDPEAIPIKKMQDY